MDCREKGQRKKEKKKQMKRGGGGLIENSALAFTLTQRYVLHKMYI